MHTREYLRYSSAGRVPPDHDVAKSQLLCDSDDVFNVILYQIGSVGIPGRVTIAEYIYSHHVLLRCEIRRDVIERMRHASDAVKDDYRLFVRGTPVEVMDAEAIDCDETVGWLLELKEEQGL